MVLDKFRLRIIGSVIGLLAPTISLWIFYMWNFPNLPFQTFIQRMMFSNLFAPLLSLCILINLLAFFGFIWTDRDEGARGVLFTTFLYGFVVLILKIT
jgi:hypothetical protein